MTKIITHANLWWWGKSYTFISDDGMAIIEIAISDERPDLGELRSLMVHESARQKGIGTTILRFAEHKAQKLKLEQLCLNARKGTFLIDWYRRHGYEIYDENCEYSNGQTVGMYKNLDQPTEEETA